MFTVEDLRTILCKARVSIGVSMAPVMKDVSTEIGDTDSVDASVVEVMQNLVHTKACGKMMNHKETEKYYLPTATSQFGQ
jgi:hypothetical protein